MGEWENEGAVGPPGSNANPESRVRNKPPRWAFTPRSLLAISEGVDQRAFFQSYCRLGNRLLGEGSTSIVYAVAPRDQVMTARTEGCVPRDLCGPEAFACKDILLDRYRLGCGGRTPEAVCAELDIMQEMDHPNIARLFDVGVDHFSAKLVVEYLPGGDLSASLARGGCFVEEVAREIMAKLLNAVGFMHAHNVVHRDIKLDNILHADVHDITSVKLIDMGMAVRLDVPTEQLSISGSPLYMAPEVITPTSMSPNGRKLSTYGTKADLWSCGVVLFIMLCGYPPFDPATGIPTLFQSIRTGDFSMNGDPTWEFVSHNAQDLVQRLLTLDPAQRISAAEALCHPWFK